MTGSTAGQDQIAIVGMSVLLPGATSLEAYWDNLVRGVDSISEIPPDRWGSEHFYDPQASGRPDRVYCRRGGFIGATDFDPLAFGIMPDSVRDIDVDQLIALRVTAEAIEDAGGRDRLPDPDRIGVILGRAGSTTLGQGNFLLRVRLASQVRRLVQDMVPELSEDRLDTVEERIAARFGPYRGDAAIGLVPNLTASRIANRLDLRGPAYTLDAACASSLIALDHGVAELLRHRLDAVLVGGVHHTHDVTFWAIFSQLGALSRQGRIRPFDVKADGLLMGEGTGVVVLKRLSDAIRNDDRIYAVVRGVGVASDGKSASLVNPETSGQVLSATRAWAAAGLDPTAADAVGMLEAHGTATPTGDASELATIATVFGPHRGGPRPVIGSVKSMIGHAMAAAGIAGLIKATLAVSRGVLLPTLSCDTPRPELLDTRFAPIAQARPWEGVGPRRVGVNAFGFGGINAHVIVEQFSQDRVAAGPHPAPSRTTATEAAPLEVREPDQILLFSAADHSELARFLEADDNLVRLRGSTWTKSPDLSQGAEGCRLAIVDPTTRRLNLARRIVATGNRSSLGRDVWFSPRPLLSGGGSMAFVFPGTELEFAPRVDDVSAHFGLPLNAFSGPGLREQIAGGLKVGQMLHEALGRLDVVPDVLAGHSVGEWTAGLVAGVVDGLDLDGLAATLDDDALQRKGLLTSVISADAGTVTAVLADFPGVILSHDNAPTQSVVCGPADQVSRLVTTLRQQRRLCQMLPFSGGAHTPYLEPLLWTMRQAAQDRPQRNARWPIWSATTAALVPTDPIQQRDLFFRHLVEPVRFRETVSAMYDSGVRVFLQVGPGHLAGLMHENLRDKDHLAIAANVSQRSGMGQLRRVAAALWVEGAGPDFRALDGGASRMSLPLREDPAERQKMPMKMDLSFHEATLGPAGAGLLRLTGVPGSESSRPSAEEALAEPAAISRPAGDVSGPVDQPGLEADFAALMAETARSAAVVFAAADRTTEMLPVQRTAGKVPSQLPGKSAESRTTLHLSVEAMPYLRDHCFFQQPVNWPVLADSWPVVPATALIQHMIDAVQQAQPRRPVVRIVNARFTRWLRAEPESDVEIRVRPESADRFRVAVDSAAHAILETDISYPPAPSRWVIDPEIERAAVIEAPEMYQRRLLFHGPQFQGLRTMLAIGDRHARGMIEPLAAPGALLDSGLHVADNWAKSTLAQRNVTLPVSFDSVQFYGPPPELGRVVECIARVTALDNAQIVSELQFVQSGHVWALVQGMVTRRFDSHPRARRMEIDPQKDAVSELQPEGWVLVSDCWTDPTTQGFVAHHVLGAADYGEYEDQPIAQRKHWLLGRLAVKDAVRFNLWHSGVQNVFPIEVRVRGDADGQLTVEGWPWAEIAAYDVSCGRAGEVAVAMARPARPDRRGVGIEVAQIGGQEEVDSRSETALLDHLTGGREAELMLWRTCFWAAKRAAAKAEGLNPGVAPHRLRVTTACPGELVVTGAQHSRRIKFREIANPEGLPLRQYIVAWTAEPDIAGRL